MRYTFGSSMDLLVEGTSIVQLYTDARKAQAQGTSGEA